MSHSSSFNRSSLYFLIPLYMYTVMNNICSSSMTMVKAYSIILPTRYTSSSSRKGTTFLQMSTISPSSSSRTKNIQKLKVHENKYLNELNVEKLIPRPLVVCGPSGVGKVRIPSSFFSNLLIALCNFSSET